MNEWNLKIGEKNTKTNKEMVQYNTIVPYEPDIYILVWSPNKTQCSNILRSSIRLNIVSDSLRLIKDLLLQFLYMTTWYDLLFIYTFMVYCIIKIPINSFIYSNIYSWIFAFLLALLCSWFISKLAKKLFKYIFKNIESYEYILNTYVLNSLTCLVIDCFPSLVYTIPVAPRYPSNVQVTWAFRNDNIVKKGNIIYRRIRRLEPLVSAIGRDNTDARHLALYDALSEHIILSKGELRTMREEILRNNWVRDEVIHLSRYWEEIID